MDKLNDKDFYDRIKNIIEDPKYLQNKDFYMHGNITNYDHQISVAYECYKWCLKHNRYDEDLIIAALLHDYFLYDWHDRKKYPRKGLHGFTHAVTAAKNAKRDFNISDKSMSIIKTHMFPLPIHRFPRYKESWILKRFDRRCAIKEMRASKRERKMENICYNPIYEK